LARIRSIKPEFPQSESMGRVSRDARLTFIQLWTIADDEGRLRGNSRMLASLLFPYDDDAKDLIDSWLSELEREGCVGRYCVDGTSYLQIHNWLSHQKIDHPSASKIPPFDEVSRIVAKPRDDSPQDQGLEGKGKEVNGKARVKPLAPPDFDPSSVPNLDPEAWALWVEHRKAIKKPIRPHSMRDSAEELAKLGSRQLAEVKRARAGGWQGIHPERPSAAAKPAYNPYLGAE
jgi:hypothetical protein